MVNTGPKHNLTVNERVLQDLLNGDWNLPVLQVKTALPTLGESQVREAISVIPANYSELNCCMCHLDAKYTSNFPWLTAGRLFYFSYMYHLHQIPSNPQMANFLDEVFICILANDLDNRCVANQLVSKNSREDVNPLPSIRITPETLLKSIHL